MHQLVVVLSHQLSAVRQWTDGYCGGVSSAVVQVLVHKSCN